MDAAAGLLVLQLSHNLISSSADKPLPSGIFTKCTDLRFLDLSWNQLHVLPVRINCLQNLRVLVLSGNPLATAKFKRLEGLASLRQLGLRDTGMTVANMPTELAAWLPELTELDLGENELTAVPPCVYLMQKLERLQLDGNQIKEIDGSGVVGLKCMKSFNIARNQINTLPATLSQLAQLEKLVVNRNHLTAIPATFGNLKALVQLQLQGNQLKQLPASVFMLSNLQELNLKKNLFSTLPAAARQIVRLKLDGDVTIAKPPKAAPIPMAATYGVDFSTIVATTELARRWKPGIRASDMSPQKAAPSPGFLRNRGADANSKMILHGLTGVAAQQNKEQQTSGVHDPTEAIASNLGEDAAPLRKAKPWSEGLMTNNTSLDLSSMFAQEVKTTPGVHVWCIEQFMPVAVTDEAKGKFAENDCYLVLHTERQRSDRYEAMHHTVYFWVGRNATLDKKASVAISTMYLKSFVGSTKVSKREDQGEESVEFLALYNGGRNNTNLYEVVAGGTETGFYQVIEDEHINRLYLLDGEPGAQLRCTSMPPVKTCLSAEHIFVLDAVDSLYLWCGANASQALFQRARLFVAKMQQTLVQPSAIDTTNWHLRPRSWKPLIEVTPGEEPAEFSAALGANASIKFSVPDHSPKLYEVVLGAKFIELPQVAKPRQQYYTFSKDALHSTGVFILDNGSDMYVWKGRDASRLLKAAASRLVPELERMSNRPDHMILTDTCEGHEPLTFKNLFNDWNDVLETDHRAQDVKAVEAYVTTRLARGETPFAKMAVSVDELLQRTPDTLSDVEAHQLDDRCGRVADDSEFTSYVHQGKNFKMVRNSIGRFRSSDCYVFLVKEWQDIADADVNDEGAEDQQELRSVTAYFWQGRDAGNMGWLTFVHSFKKQIEPLVLEKYHKKLDIVREFQQRESLPFMALFRCMMAIYTGALPKSGADAVPQLFQLHAWKPSTFTRCIEVPCTTARLTSHSIFILRVPNEEETSTDDVEEASEDETRGTVYVWVGSKADKANTALAQQIAAERIGMGCKVTVFEEGTETADFFSNMEGGQDGVRAVDQSPGAGRLFLCSCTSTTNTFSVVEQKPQRAQDDLDTQGTAILHVGKNLFVWCGNRASDVLVKMTLAAGTEFIRRSTDCLKRVVVHEGAEPALFASAFHGWGRYIQWSLDLGRRVPMLKHILDPLPIRAPIGERHADTPFLWKPQVQKKQKHWM
jgi:hypothetical protein